MNWRLRVRQSRALRPALVAVRRRQVERELRDLHAVLEDSPISGRYWVFGGVVLGWAREGGLLRHDLDDVDFCYRSEDRDRFVETIPILERAGFAMVDRYRNRAGTITEENFRRVRPGIDFFRLEQSANGQRRYYVYGADPRSGVWHELVAEIPAQPLDTFELLDRKWLKSRDHELELDAMYGNWRVPDPNWSYFDDLAIVERHPLAGPHQCRESFSRPRPKGVVKLWK
jgi:hypothetical protein